MYVGHHGPIYSLERNPFFPKFFLTIGGARPPTTWTPPSKPHGPNHLGLRHSALPAHRMAVITSGCVCARPDWTARIWMEDIKTPVMTTMYHSNYLTAGCVYTVHASNTDCHLIVLARITSGCGVQSGCV